MDRAKIDELVAQLEDADSGWMGDARREVALRALQAETGQELGPDPAAWREWLSAHDAPTGGGGGGPPMSKEGAQALDLLVEMGLVDEETFLASNHMDKLRLDPGLAPALFLYLKGYVAKGVPLSHMNDELWDWWACEKLGERMQAVFGRNTRVEVEPKESEGKGRGFRIRLGPFEELLGKTGSTPREVFALMQRYAEWRQDGGAVWIDEYDHARVLSPDNVAAIRKYKILRLRALNRESPGEPHANVRAAMSWLEDLGAMLKVAPERLAWKVNEYDPAVMPTRLSYQTQLIHLADAGVEFAVKDFWDDHARPLTRRMSVLVGQDLSRGPDFEDLDACVARINTELHETRSPWHILAFWVNIELYWARMLPVPIDRVAKIAAVTECIAGHEDVPDRESGLERFTFGVSPTIERVAPGAPTLVFDGECVDSAEHYAPLVR